MASFAVPATGRAHLAAQMPKRESKGASVGIHIEYLLVGMNYCRHDTTPAPAESRVFGLSISFEREVRLVERVDSSPPRVRRSGAVSFGVLAQYGLP